MANSPNELIFTATRVDGGAAITNPLIRTFVFDLVGRDEKSDIEEEVDVNYLGDTFTRYGGLRYVDNVQCYDVTSQQIQAFYLFLQQAQDENREITVPQLQTTIGYTVGENIAFGENIPVIVEVGAVKTIRPSVKTLSLKLHSVIYGNRP